MYAEQVLLAAECLATPVRAPESWYTWMLNHNYVPGNTKVHP